jgi:hypothetical protein
MNAHSKCSRCLFWTHIHLHNTSSKSVAATRHVEILLVALSDGPIGSASWFAYGSVDNKVTETATLGMMPPRDASVVGRGEDNLAYFCVNYAWYILESDGRVILRTPKSPLVRLVSPVLVR